jgi:hypothetical protein
MTEDQATSLTPEQIGALRARAAQEAGPFVDPRVLQTPIHNAEWASDILGRSYGGERSIGWTDRYLLHIAQLAEPHPPEPPKATAARARAKAELEALQAARAQEHDRQVREWETLAARLPVQVDVRHNYTSHRHLDTYTQGGDHIYLHEDLNVGRLHRTARLVLCWTPSRAKDLREFPEPATDGRVPSCRQCLRIAHRIAT